MAAARQLSGIPAPRNSPTSSTASSRADSPAGFADRINAHNTKQQEELAAREAEAVQRRGEAEAAVASQGGYSEDPRGFREGGSGTSSGVQSRDTSPDRFRDNFVHQRRNQVWSDEGDRRGATGTLPSQMSQVELAAANANLLKRIEPFMANPLQNTSLSAFFYNDDKSVMRQFETDTAGQFTYRAALDFVPTEVRILASDKMSAVTPIKIVEPHGVNVISDIDDTIKHTAISAGSKEIFRNVFIRDVSELSIEGVPGWYSKMAKLGCEFHYVSNSPWQLFPVLETFFKHAGLPPGSFHLKAYSGMLQGIFEPVAERKKATLDKLMRDFPDRRFILVGDSGEADLEVYRDTVKEYPGRVLGVFIRDVTTSKRRSFFDPASSLNGANGSSGSKPKAEPQNVSGPMVPSRGNATEEDTDIREAIARSLADVGTPSYSLERSLSRHEKRSSRGSPARPPLPPRTKTAPEAPEENLIDLDSDHDNNHHVEPPDELPQNWLRAPPRPSKPRSLSSTRIERSSSRQASADAASTSISSKTPPPRPRKPSTSVNATPSQANFEKPPPLPLHSKPSNTILESPDGSLPTKPPRPEPPPPRQSYRAAARQRISSVYSQLPSPKEMVFGSRPGTPKSSPSHSREGSFTENIQGRSNREPSLAELIDDERMPPVPPRKPGSLASTLRGSEYGDDRNVAYGDERATRQISRGSVYGDYNAQNGDVLSKKEQNWNWRWASARKDLESRGVILRSWRIGEDAQKDALRLIEGALKDEKKGRTERE